MKDRSRKARRQPDNKPTPREDRLSRRSFLAAAGAVGAVGAVAATPLLAASDLTAIAPTCPAGTPVSAGSADVVVVGAGFAGLAAARQLAAAGASVVVLEARERVGGRTLNAAIGGGKVIEVGGQWAGPTQTRLLDVAAELGVGTFPTYTTGDNLLYYQGDLLPYDGASALSLPPIPQADLNEFLTVVIGQLDPLATRIPLDAPWAAAGVDVRALDGQTVETWKLANLQTPGARFLFDLAVEAVFAAEPRDLSLLHFLFYVHAGGGLTPLVSVTDGAQEKRFVGGSQLVAQRMAATLPRRVVLGAPVRRITDLGDSVVVATDTQAWRAGRVIVSLPPTLASRIDYAPTLPSARDQLTQRSHGIGHQVPGDLRSAVLARRRAHRPGHERHRSGQGHVRQLTPRRHARRSARLHRGRGSPSLERASRRRPTRSRPRVVRALLRRQCAHGARLRRARLVLRPVDTRLLRRLPAAGCAHQLRAGAACPGRADPLGRHRDRRGLERLHRGRDPLR